MAMFCYQCEETAQGTGCTTAGVCGKDATTAALQDLLIHAVKGIAMYAHRSAQMGVRDRAIDVFVLEALFTTVTNVDFDPDRLRLLLKKAGDLLQQAKAQYETACAEAGKTPEDLSGPTSWKPSHDADGLVKQGEQVAITKRQTVSGEDVIGMQELITYGLKGAAAYLDHAQILGKEDPDVYAALHARLDFLARDNVTLDELLLKALETGGLSLRAMRLLAAANTEAYGHPEPTQVRVTPIKGKAILVSGHDLKDLDQLLRQTEDRGISVYTHGEMLPCLAYPRLKKYKHLVGNYGGAWWEQRKEFDEFPGAIVMTTNCIQHPKDSYNHRTFTTGLVAWPGVAHIGPDRDFSPVIKAALAAPGFAEDAPEKTITIGFAHNAVLVLADKIVEAVKKGAIKRFFLVGGCDGRYRGRSYYTELVQKIPHDCVVLTLGCGKYRFNKLDLGRIDGIPRLLDMGQCNDAYSAIQVASALAEAFGCAVNDLPLSLVVSWYEQKAVTVLLALLHLGIKNIRLGPRLPAFLTPPVLKVLVDKFNIAPIKTPEEDLQEILG